ncbi:hypothetical protein [Aeromonas dhakensis]|uniref:hypothetical protein n=1 Tax=Aeromonas dhakensis TaxID=196024 RepID=UPI00301CD13D
MSILQNSFDLAKDSAVEIWSLVGAQYINNNDVLHPVELKVQKAISTFSLNARRVLESFDKSKKFGLNHKCWSPSGNIDQSEIELDLWNALNLIVHANSFEVFFEHLPDHLSYISEDNKVISYVQVSTDRRSGIYVDPFSMAYSFLSEVQAHYQNA